MKILITNVKLGLLVILVGTFFGLGQAQAEPNMEELKRFVANGLEADRFKYVSGVEISDEKKVITKPPNGHLEIYRVFFDAKLKNEENGKMISYFCDLYFHAETGKTFLNNCIETIPLVFRVDLGIFSRPAI